MPKRLPEFESVYLACAAEIFHQKGSILAKGHLPNCFLSPCFPRSFSGGEPPPGLKVGSPAPREQALTAVELRDWRRRRVWRNPLGRFFGALGSVVQWFYLI